MSNKIKGLIILSVIMILGVGFTPTDFALAQTNDEIIQQLRDQIEALQARIKALRQELKPDISNTSPAKPNPKPYLSKPEQKSFNCGVFSHILYKGVNDKNTKGEVTRLQKMLAEDFAIYPEGLITGYYGRLTEKAVQKWQKKHGVVSSGSPSSTGYGVVGPRTRAKITIVCPEKPIKETPITDEPIEPQEKSITVISPNGGEVWEAEKTYKIKYSLKNINPASGISIYLQKGYNADSPKTGVNSRLLIGNTSNREAYSYTVPSSIKFWPGLGDNYTIKICNTGSCTIADSSDSYFKITDRSTINHPPIINEIPIIIPSNIKVNQSTSFIWSAVDFDGDDLAWSVSWGDGNEIAELCSKHHPQDKKGWIYKTSHSWEKAGTYTVKTTVRDCKGGSSQAKFNVTVSESIEPSLNVISPNGGEAWGIGTEQKITWQDRLIAVICPVGEECDLAASYYDISILRYFSPCIGEICRILDIAPYVIASKVQGLSYSWLVGTTMNDRTIPAGLYAMKVCQTGSNVCDSSDSYFKIVNDTAIPPTDGGY